jgi:diguanylate cyclase (GGDEF)-like protein
MHGGDLQPWLDQWLSGQSRRWNLRFPAKLEATYERDTGVERGHTLSLFTIAGCAAYLAWTIAGVLAGDRWPNRLIQAASIIPAGLLIAFAFNRGLRPLRRETLASLLIMASSLGLTALYATGLWSSAALSTTGVIIAMLIGAQILQLRFPFAVASTIVMMSGQCLALMQRPPSGGDSVVDYVQALGFAAAIALFANWRQERDARRTYLVGLKERLGRQELSQHNRELDDLTRRDPLTGLPNRRAFDAWLATPIDSSAADRLVGLIAIDIDHFKPFNDYYGHPAGDQCLRQVADCLRENARGQTDLVARIGGEEFAIMLVGAGRNDAIQLAHQLRAAVENLALPHDGAGAGGHVTITAGVANAFVLDKVSLQALAKRADAALYAAKQAGRNQVRVAE